VDMQVSMTKAQAQQLTLLIGFENILLPNDLIIIQNHRDDDEDVGEGFGGVEDQQGSTS
jgi:hypothetical protein